MTDVFYADIFFIIEFDITDAARAPQVVRDPRIILSSASGARLKVSFPHFADACVGGLRGNTCTKINPAAVLKLLCLHSKHVVLHKCAGIPKMKLSCWCAGSFEAKTLKYMTDGWILLKSTPSDSKRRFIEARNTTHSRMCEVTGTLID